MRRQLLFFKVGCFHTLIVIFWICRWNYNMAECATERHCATLFRDASRSWTCQTLIWSTEISVWQWKWNMVRGLRFEQSYCWRFGVLGSGAFFRNVDVSSSDNQCKNLEHLNRQLGYREHVKGRNKWGVRMWVGFIWLGIGTYKGLLPMFSKYLGTTSKFLSPQGWRVRSYTLRAHK